uniref:Uncharacterized protein n=1 Tax=Zea mays TaxID=4577 RepID=C4J958_MAIZE|nr:unknown [Zea mays]
MLFTHNPRQTFVPFQFPAKTQGHARKTQGQSFSCPISLVSLPVPSSYACVWSGSLLRVKLASSASGQPGLSVRNCSQNLSFTTTWGPVCSSGGAWLPRCGLPVASAAAPA